MHYWLHFFARLRRTGTAKIADYLDDGSLAREEPNNFSFKFKNETETLEMKSKEKNIGDFKQNWQNVYHLISVMRVVSFSSFDIHIIYVRVIATL